MTIGRDYTKNQSDCRILYHVLLEKNINISLHTLMFVCLFGCLSFFFIKLQDISADTVMDAFQGWISMVCSVEVPLVLCSGTLLSFDAQG